MIPRNEATTHSTTIGAEGIGTASSISVVVPVYNSERVLPELIARLEPVLSRSTGTFELVLVNDGSRDHSWEAICQGVEQHRWIRGINLMRNYGQHNALLAGIRAATGDVIVTMDDDLQHPPEEIPKLLEKLAEGYDVVYGTPEREQHALWRNMASRATKLVLQDAMGAENARNVSAFRVLRTKVRDAFQHYRDAFVSIDVLLTWGTMRFAAVRVRHEPRRIGVSNYTIRQMVIHALNMITGFSPFPLQVASVIGFAFTLFGFAVFCFVMGRFLFLGHSVPGFPFLASVIAIFSGAQLFSLGIIGEYLVRMHSRSMEKPTYVIRDLRGGKAT